MIKKAFLFFQQRDPDLEIFSQVFAMFVSNLIGLFFWLILRFPCSMLIVLAPGIIVAIVFKEKKCKSIFNISFLTSTVIAAFYLGTIMLSKQPIFQIGWVALTVYIIFSNSKTRYLASFALLPCSLAFHMPSGALSVINRIIESYMSAVFAIVVVIIIKEVLAQYKIKRLFLILIKETETLFSSKLGGYSQKNKTLSIEDKIKNFTLKAVYLIEDYRYLTENNRLFARHSLSLLNAIIRVSRAITVIESSNTIETIAEIEQIKDNLNRVYTAVLNNTPIQITSYTKFSENKCCLSFKNYFSIKNILDDLKRINNYQLQE